MTTRSSAPHLHTVMHTPCSYTYQFAHLFTALCPLFTPPFTGAMRIDDALDVSSIHGVTGVMGSLLIGLYASTDVNPAGPAASLGQLSVQAVGVGVAILWSGIGAPAGRLEPVTPNQ
jgi:ammonia channel protein AmtB